MEGEGEGVGAEGLHPEFHPALLQEAGHGEGRIPQTSAQGPGPKDLGEVGEGASQVGRLQGKQFLPGRQGNRGVSVAGRGLKDPPGVEDLGEKGLVHEAA